MARNGWNVRNGRAGTFSRVVLVLAGLVHGSAAVAEEPSPGTDWLYPQDWEFERPISTDLALSGRQTPSGVDVEVRTTSACSLRARVGLFRTIYTGVVPCILDDRGDYKLAGLDRKRRINPEYELSHNGKRKRFAFWDTTMFDGSIFSWNEELITDLGDHLAVSGGRSDDPEPGKFIVRIDAGYEPRVQQALVRRLIEHDNAPKMLIATLRPPIASEAKTTFPFVLEEWKTALCDGYKQLGSAPLADDAPFSVAGWERAMKLARDATCPSGTKAFQGVACKKAARVLVEAYATGDAAPLQRAVDANCDMSVVRTTMEAVAGERLRKMLTAHDDEAAQALIAGLERANLPRWHTIAEETQAAVRLKETRDAFLRALSKCESDASAANCDEALRQASVATTEERTRISAVKAARVKVEDEAKARSARQAEYHTRLIEARAERWRSMENTACSAQQVYVGRRVGALIDICEYPYCENNEERYFGGEFVYLRRVTVMGIGSRIATVADESGNTYEVDCRFLNLPCKDGHVISVHSDPECRK